MPLTIALLVITLNHGGFGKMTESGALIGIALFS